MPLLPDAEPAFFRGQSPAVLVLHGFTGQPHSVKPWAEYLHREGGLTVSVPRLPGHGTTWQEMNKTTWQDWYAEAQRCLRQLLADHDEVFVCGLSMGASLTLRLAQEHGDDIAGIVVVNPAVFTTRPDRFALPVLRHIVGAFPGITNDIKKPGGDELGYDKIPLQAAYSMTKLWALVKENLAQVEVPMRVFTSVDDHVVEPANSQLVLDRVGSADKEQVMLHDSYHVATLDNDADVIFAGTLEFIRSRSGRTVALPEAGTGEGPLTGR